VFDLRQQLELLHQRLEPLEGPLPGELLDRHLLRPPVLDEPGLRQPHHPEVTFSQAAEHAIPADELGIARHVSADEDGPGGTAPDGC
jgi:hypothetical protein